MMKFSKTFVHCTPKSEYTVILQTDEELRLQVREKYQLCFWKGVFTMENIKDTTFKTGHELFFEEFINTLIRGFQQRDINCYVDILSSQDLENLKNKKNNTNQHNITQNSTLTNKSKSNKRYVILTYMTNQHKYHYPLPLATHTEQHQIDQLKHTYNQLRVQLQAARTAALNDTSKTDQSFSIHYDQKNNGKYEAKKKEVDQIKSQNQILKAQMLRLQQQTHKNRANIQIQAAIVQIQRLKENIQTGNLDLVDWKIKLEGQEQNHRELKREMNKLHKKICSLLVTQKELTMKKKGEQAQKELNLVKNNVKKNTLQIDKLKKDLEATKARVKQLQIRAKKLNSQKEVIRRGGARRGPYSSAGSVRSFNSFSSKRSYGASSISSKGRSNYSYNSYKIK